MSTQVPRQVSPFLDRHVALVAAHPDDEVLGAGAQFRTMRRLSLVHMTDGAPRHLAPARTHGFPTAEAYAAARERELQAALALADNAAERYCLGFVDQRLSRNLAQAARKLASLLQTIQPELILTHAYEGGHPDHDATAFAVRAATHFSESSVPIWEMTGYHRQDGKPVFGDFLPRANTATMTISLSKPQQQLKRHMLECFLTQRAVLPSMPIDVERFRVAPAYDFTAPPHVGQLHYEWFDWGMIGARWRRLAAAAESELSTGAERRRP